MHWKCKARKEDIALKTHGKILLLKNKKGKRIPEDSYFASSEKIKEMASGTKAGR